MTKTLPFAILASAALLSGGAAFATTTPAKPAHAMVATKTVATSHTTTATKTAAPIAATTTHHAVATHVAATSHGRMVTTRTSTGKTVTYDCSKAGNATKTACKK